MYILVCREVETAWDGYWNFCLGWIFGFQFLFSFLSFPFGIEERFWDLAFVLPGVSDEDVNEDGRTKGWQMEQGLKRRPGWLVGSCIAWRVFRVWRSGRVRQSQIEMSVLFETKDMYDEVVRGL
jgi:hypothetical protein